MAYWNVSTIPEMLKLLDKGVPIPIQYNHNKIVRAKNPSELNEDTINPNTLNSPT
jgi:hypothetical protein